MSAALYASLLALAVFAAVLAVGALVAWSIVARGDRRLRIRLRGGDQTETDAAETASMLLDSLARSGRQLGRAVDSEGEISQLMTQAGWRDSRSRLLFQAVQAALPMALLGVIIVLWLAGTPWLQGNYLFVGAFVALAVSWLVPLNVLRHLAEARRRRIDAEVPLFVHLLVLLFEAGLSTRQAFATIAREGHGTLPELGRELELIVRQIDAGGDAGGVMSAFGEAQGIDDLSSIFAILRQVDRYGGEVREPLMDALRTIEDRRSMEVREKVNRLSGQMTVVMVLFFFPALLVFVAGPAFTSILRMFRSMH